MSDAVKYELLAQPIFDDQANESPVGSVIVGGHCKRGGVEKQEKHPLIISDRDAIRTFLEKILNLS